MIPIVLSDNISAALATTSAEATRSRPKSIKVKVVDTWNSHECQSLSSLVSPFAVTIVVALSSI